MSISVLASASESSGKSGTSRSRDVRDKNAGDFDANAGNGEARDLREGMGARGVRDNKAAGDTREVRDGRGAVGEEAREVNEAGEVGPMGAGRTRRGGKPVDAIVVGAKGTV